MERQNFSPFLFPSTHSNGNLSNGTFFERFATKQPSFYTYYKEL